MALRSKALQAAHTSAAYIQDKIFKEAAKLPWALVQGDAWENLLKLKDQASGLDDTCLKLQRLLQLGYPRVALEQAVKLMGEVPWTTMVVEQGHGSMAAIRRQHHYYGKEMLCQRAFIHMLRPLFHEPEKPKAQVAFEKALESRRKKQPQKITGRHAFLADLAAASQGSGSGQWTPAVAQ
eukprot:2401071-Lingulodinium_polyedra.AAC.1